tara:strand:- start:155 stop:415 length:261 start_codon:yes stop_codon:yes gene_type:complete
MNTVRSNTGKLFIERDHSETIVQGSVTGSFFGIQALHAGCQIGSINPVGEAVIASLLLSTGSIYPFEFTSFRIESGSAIIYQQSTD